MLGLIKEQRSLLDLIKNQLSNYIDNYEFVIVHEFVNDDNFGITYLNKEMQIRLVSYHRDLYVYSSPTFDLEEEASIFNIMNFMNLKKSIKISPDYYYDLESINEAFCKQVEFISCVLKENMDILVKFHAKKGFKKRIKELGEYVMTNNPEIFNKNKIKPNKAIQPGRSKKRSAC